MRFFYTGDFEQLKEYDYKLDSKGSSYCKQIMFGNSENQVTVNTIYILTRDFKGKKRREIINIMLNKQMVKMTIYNKDIQDLVKDKLVKISRK